MKSKTSLGIILPVEPTGIFFPRIKGIILIITLSHDATTLLTHFGFFGTIDGFTKTFRGMTSPTITTTGITMKLTDGKIIITVRTFPITDI
jgi:hypothetical protein